MSVKLDATVAKLGYLVDDFLIEGAGKALLTGYFGAPVDADLRYISIALPNDDGNTRQHCKLLVARTD